MKKLIIIAALAMSLLVTQLCNAQAQVIDVDGRNGGKQFDGIGAVSGGGATSVLLKDYPELQRSQILDFLFKPKFGASMSALYVEIPGDGNSTQGSELSHMHARNDLNYSRGYEWWLINEAKKRNKDISLDGCAWGAPGWVGNYEFSSHDMCEYYINWIQGLKKIYGWDMNAIGYRNEKGVDEGWVKMFRKTLDSSGLVSIKIHGFDNWEKNKWDWLKDMRIDTALRNAISVVSNHTIYESPAPDSIQQYLDSIHKPIWNSEEHVYKRGFDCEISLVHVFNQNYIRSGVTKIVCWYLVSAFYPVECYYNITTINAATPWSGNYTVNPALWAYAHYGQFARIGWKYLDGACGNLPGGGSYVTLTSGTDYSMIIETQAARSKEPITLNIKGGLSTGPVTVWRSDSVAQFVRQTDILPVKGSYSLDLEPGAIYTISTTRGQQKGSFTNIPAAKSFPFPYRETFDHYTDPKRFGYLPHYTADIDGGFEIIDRPDGKGKCLQQAVAKKPQSWAPEWMPYTILGDSAWTDYDVSADICIGNTGWAGILGRVINTGGGYGCNPKGYYMRLYADGKCGLYASTQAKNGDPGRLLASGKATPGNIGEWRNVKLRFQGQTITGFVDNKQVFAVNDDTYKRGMIGLVTGIDGINRNTAMFDDLIIKAVNTADPPPAVFVQDKYQMYKQYRYK